MTSKCKVELAVTINTGDFSSVKATVGFEEAYIEGGRDTKFNELLEVCNDKLDEAVLSAIKKIKLYKK